MILLLIKLIAASHLFLLLFPLLFSTSKHILKLQRDLISNYYGHFLIVICMCLLGFPLYLSNALRDTLGTETISPFKYDEKCFLFHVKSWFCSLNIYTFELTF